MFNRRISAGLMSGVVAVGLVLSGQAAAAFTAQEAAKLDAEAQATLAKFQADTKGSAEVFANAKGVLVCPRITKGGFILGVESGDCVLTSGAPKPIYYGTSALKGGLLVGISWYSMILVLNTDAAVAKFTSGTREWEMGVDASVAVATVGAGGALDTTNLKKDIVSFIFSEKGLMGDVSFSGSRFKKLDVE
jgi:lipid-binding SYLF domain-containing protein